MDGSRGAFEPIDGDWYMYSQRADVSYKRLLRTIDLTGVALGGPDLTVPDLLRHRARLGLRVRRGAHGRPGRLDDAAGRQRAHRTRPARAAPEGWFELHPWLERYQGADCSGTNPTTGGAWNATSGRSAGWEEWKIDLSAYAGQQVEVSISYASDWGTQGVGAFVDAIDVSTGEGSTSFEENRPDGRLDRSGPAEGSAINANDGSDASVGFSEGAVTTTDDTLYFGFGLEGIIGADSRATVLGRSLDYLLD